MADPRETQDGQATFGFEEVVPLSDPLENYYPEGDHPSDAMTRVSIDADKLSPEDVEGRKELMRLLDGAYVDYRGDFRYDLMLGVTEEGKEFLELELLPSDIPRQIFERFHDGMIGEPSAEIDLSRTFSRGTRTPLRTGYMVIEDERMWARDEVGIERYSTPPLKSLLRLHFPEHEVAVRDVDR